MIIAGGDAMNDMIGKRIKHYRKIAGLTQDELSRMIGVTRAALCHWEVGRASPKYDEQKKLATALGCTLSDLIGDAMDNDTERIISLCRKISPEQKTEIIHQLEYMVYQNERKEKSIQSAMMA